MAEIDALCALAEVSNEEGYCCPKILDAPDDDDPNQLPHLIIKETSVPVFRIGYSTEPASFVSNDVIIDHKDSRCLLITGRQVNFAKVNLMVIMAQLGCFVPAEEMSITVVD